MSDYIDKIEDDKSTVTTSFGNFSQEYFGSVYTIGEGPDGAEKKYPVGANMYMKFMPNEQVTDAHKFGFMQKAQYKKNGNPEAPDKRYDAYTVKSDKSFIDQDPGKNNPLYATDKAHKSGKGDDIAGYKTTFPVRNARKWGKDTAGGTVKGRKWAGHGQFGERYTDKEKKLVSKPAIHQDTPHDPDYSSYKKIEYDFETTVLAFSGGQAGTYFGSVAWGFEIEKTQVADPKDAAKKIDSYQITGRSVSKLSDGNPTTAFFNAVKAWNESKKASGREGIVEAPTGAGQVTAKDAKLYKSEKEIDAGNSIQLAENSHCMIFNTAKLGKSQNEYTHVRIEEGKKVLTGWVEAKYIQKTT